MSIIQNNNLRYIKRNNLEQEAKLISNYYRDIINAYGVDCKYFKVDFDLPDTIDTLPLSSTIYQSIYGSDASMMSYTLSADMISYMEVDDDLFMLNKYGVTPETEVTFFFDIKDFAAKFATQLGRYDEYAIEPITINSITLNNDVLSGNVDFTSEIMSGTIDLTNTIEASSGVVQCSTVSATIPEYNIPVNEYLAKYFTYDIEGGDAPLLSQFTYETISADVVTASLSSFSSDATPPGLSGSLLWYNTETIVNNETIYYDETDTYAYWNDGSKWLVTIISDVDTTPINYYSNIDYPLTINVANCSNVVFNGQYSYAGIENGHHSWILDNSINSRRIKYLSSPFNCWCIGEHSFIIIYNDNNNTLPSKTEWYTGNTPNDITLTYDIPTSLQSFGSFSGTLNITQHNEIISSTLTALSGTVTGSALYYNLDQISKYLNYIRPQVGDVIRIDFPGDDNEGEEYELTDTMDRNLTQDGINPLLHKYIWRCKALRRIPSYEDLADGNELNADQFIDVLKKKQYVEGVINDELESYEDSADDVYGGYDSAYDNEPDIATVTNLEDVEHIDSGFIIMEFANSSLLYTDGYDLFFRNTKGSITKLTLYNETSPEVLSIPIELDYLKASDHSIYFVNMEGDNWALLNTDEDGNAVESPGLTIMTSSDSNINESGENFYKFANTRSIMYCNEKDLYVRLGNDDATTIKMTIN